MTDEEKARRGIERAWRLLGKHIAALEAATGRSLQLMCGSGETIIDAELYHQGVRGNGTVEEGGMVVVDLPSVVYAEGGDPWE